MFYWLRRPPDWQITLALVILAYGLALGAFAEDPVEFWRSYPHVANLVLMVVDVPQHADRGRPEIGRSLAVFCSWPRSPRCVIIAQAASFNLLRDFRLAAILGDLAPIGPGCEVYVPSLNAVLPRANGVYSEPSVAGWFMSFAVAIALGARPLPPVLGRCAAALCTLGAMATLSLTGILGAALVWSGYLLLVRDPGGFKAIAAACRHRHGAAFYQANELGILARFAHLDKPGTSIYFRLTAPYRLISESLERYPFGYPVGQTGFIAGRHYYINWEQGSQTNIDNRLLMVVFYFGLLGILVQCDLRGQDGAVSGARRHVIGLLMLSLLIAL